MLPNGLDRDEMAEREKKKAKKRESERGTKPRLNIGGQAIKCRVK